MKKLIIDLRSNPGGLLNEAVKITNFFIPKDKVVVTTKAKIEKWSETFKTRNAPMDLEMPLAILINDRSASASEIVAGSLQDYDRAVVIGERSFGKGLVQRYRELTYGTQMKLTISKYYTPSGRCIQELDYTNRDDKGVVPKFSDQGRDSFKTENGRIVYGGGGIQPDLEIEKPKRTITTEVLLNSDAFFDYVTYYFYKNPQVLEASKFELGGNDFNDLKNYLGDNHSSFRTETEKIFLNAEKKATTEDLNTKLNKSFQAVMEQIQSEKLKELDKNKQEIMGRLTEEIVKRYYFTEGVFEQKKAYDEVILRASSVLNNSEAYNKLLQ